MSSSGSPDLNIPFSNSTVTVQALDTLTPASHGPASYFLSPTLPGRELAWFPDLAFLIEHNGRRIMFDLGLRKDQENFPPALRAMTVAVKEYGMKCNRDVVDQLLEGGIELESVEAVIWSHTHFDHIGDMSRWPHTTKLIVGPGSDRKTYPTVPDAHLLESDFAGREVQELSFIDSSLKIAGAPAIDFFGDGSLYILDLPGHLPGHLGALARVKPNSFVAFGGDTCHHVGHLRPNEFHHKTHPCPGHILTSTRKSISTEYFPSPLHPDSNEFDLARRDTPLLTIPSPDGDKPTAHIDPVKAKESIRTLSLLDSHPDVFVAIAHDLTLVEVVDLFPGKLDDWKEKGWKEKALWAFLKEDNKSFRFNPTVT
ncbi:hypothetical protein V5O48_008000 [Marasmius crinis-equi]|uniref:Metallo-beta-lactamase domain-containing protein n=1 Tax=Marasmius crinis-equi TaxID=585013 RepID=A0ABR3FF46_9AGAR